MNDPIAGLPLTALQEAAFNAVKSLSSPVSLRAILSASKGAFSSKTLLNAVLRQLTAKHLITKQSNGYYKITVTRVKPTLLTQKKSHLKREPKTSAEAISDMYSDTATDDIKTADESLNRQQSKKVVTLIETSKPNVFVQINQLSEKLSKPTITISELDTKQAVLMRLADLLQDDIGEVLLSINDDLERVAKVA